MNPTHIHTLSPVYSKMSSSNTMCRHPHSEKKRKEREKEHTKERVWGTLIRFFAKPIRPSPTQIHETARSMEKHEIHGEEAPAPAPAAIADGILLGAMQQLNDHEDGRLQAAAAAGAGGGGRFPGDLQQLIALGDRRLQAASFFLAWGCCVLINTTVMNPAANLEHKFVGFVVLTIGAWLALLTLAGAGAGRAAARAERFLMELFF